ncbi:MAG: hypothetical protein LAN64_04730 [Acidobacteriia bacterium]|nr:hypothetical protein [Terriglobia bacterium]
MKHSFCRLLMLLLCVGSVAWGQDDVVIKAMRDEMSRSISQLRLADLDKPYFIAYRVDDTTTTKISAALGQLTDKDLSHARALDVDVRVGDFALDNTNFLALSSSGFGGGNCGCHTSLPLDDDYDQIRRQIWLETDGQYKQAAAELASKRSVLKHREPGQDLPDFAPQSPNSVADKHGDLKVDVAALEKLARDLSGLFRDSPEILMSGVDVWVVDSFVRFIDSEGTSFTRAEPLIILNVRAFTRARDGQPLGDVFQVYGRSVGVLRAEDLQARTRELLARVKGLQVAADLETYNGPVLFESEAAGEVMAQVFAPAVVAFRIPLSDDPQFQVQFKQVLAQFGGSLADRMGGKVMPEYFDLTDNPRPDHLGETELLGAYAIDDEGVPTRAVAIVEAGRLKNLLATRTPTPQTKASTGSARSTGAAAPSNLFLSTLKPQTSADLRKELLRVAQQRGYGYGIVLRHLGASSVNALMRLSMARSGANTGGIAAYKLFPDGHEEMVRADVGPIPLAAFKEILAAVDKPGVYHGAFFSFGALLGGGGNARQKTSVVSFVTPSLLFDEVSVKHPEGTATKPPVLPSPLAK